MPTSTELTQLVPGDPSTLFLAIKSFNELLPQMKPHIFPHAEHHEGDGGAGTVSTYGLYEDHAAGGPLKYKTIMEVFDEATRSYIVDVQGDSRYSYVKINGKLLPGPSPGTTMFKWFADYSPVKADDTPAPDHLLAVIPHMFQDLADHLQGLTSESTPVSTGPEFQELTQLVTGDPDMLFQAIKSFDKLLPEMKPGIFPHAEHHEGDGGVGTVSTYGLHEDHAAGGPLKYKTIMEVFDEATRSYIVDVQGDSRYSHVKINGKLLPGPSSGTTMFKWFADYSPVKDDTPAPDHLLAVIPQMFQDLADHLQSRT